MNMDELAALAGRVNRDPGASATAWNDTATESDVAAIAGEVASELGRAVVLDARGAGPVAYGFQIGFDPRVRTRIADVRREHLRWGEAVFVEAQFCCFAPVWRGRWHRFLADGAQVNHDVFALTEPAWLGSRRRIFSRVAKRLASAAEALAWEAWPAAADDLKVGIGGRLARLDELVFQTASGGGRRIDAPPRRSGPDMMLPYCLSWEEVDPVRHEFDPGPALRIAADVLARGWPGGDPRTLDGRPDFENLMNEVTRALAAHYGLWACGWHWAAGEGDYGGGPVRGWCCVPHSVSTPPETAVRVQTGLVEWRSCVEAVAGRLDAAPADPERAAHALLEEVLRWTDADVEWPRLCERVFAWHAEDLGVDVEVASAWAREAVAGRFNTYGRPTPEAVREFVQHVAMTAPGR
jgi:hypothetical protein